ncbi:MAG TPA: DUF6494 family protein [Chloroflexaceae bacterium]|nr:DUF6494 family protein [Chloroflexaceae bacterium]
MQDEQLQQDIRRFLKTFGVGAQREIEAALAAARATGRLDPARPVPVRARLELLGHEFVVEDELRAGER